MLVGMGSALVIGLSMQRLACLSLCHRFVQATNMMFAIRHGMHF